MCTVVILVGGGARGVRGAQRKWATVSAFSSSEGGDSTRANF